MLRSDATNLINAVVALRNGADDQTAARKISLFHGCKDLHRRLR